MYQAVPLWTILSITFLTYTLLLTPGSVTLERSTRVERWRRAMSFWTEAICSVQNTKTINLHGIFPMGSARLLRFYDYLLRSVSKDCNAVMTMRACYQLTKNIEFACDLRWPMNFNENSTTDNPPLESSFRSKIGKVERQDFVEMWELTIIVLDDDRHFDRVFDRGSTRGFKRGWNPRQHFVVLFLPRDEDVDEEGSRGKISNILRTFWTRGKIQNVLLSCPVSSAGNSLMYSYNPFARRSESEWGSIEEIRMESRMMVLRTLASMTRRRTQNLNGYRLRIGLFEQYQVIRKLTEKPEPGSIYEYSGGYNGSDGITLGTMAKYMNFKVVPLEPSDGIKYGFELSNGTFLGTMGDVVYERANVSFVSFFVKLYGKDIGAMEFTSQVMFDRLCVVVPKAHKIPKSVRIYYIFEPTVWIFAIISQILIHLTWYFIRTTQLKRSNVDDNLSEKIDFWQTMFHSFLIVTGCPQKLPSSTTERILLTSVFLASTTMIGTLGGILYKSLAHNIYYKDINTMVELDQSGYSITVNSFGLTDIFGADDDLDNHHMTRLSKRLRHGHCGLTETAHYRNTTAVIRQSHYTLMRDDLVEEDGSRLLHMAKECPGSYYLAYLLPRNSILRERINVLLGRLSQAGLPNFWQERTFEELSHQRRHVKQSKSRRFTDDFVPFQLTDLQISFYTLAIGLSFATIAFFNERGWLRRCGEKCHENVLLIDAKLKSS